MQLGELLATLARLSVDGAGLGHCLEVAILPFRRENLVHRRSALIHEPQMLVELRPNLGHLR